MRVLERVKQAFWEEVAKSCPYATFFHNPYWSKLREYPHNAWIKENNFFKKMRNIKISLSSLYKKNKNVSSNDS